VILETERLRLRPVRVDDLEPFVEIFGDPEVMRFVAWGRAHTRDEVVAMIERLRLRFAADGFGQLAVERRETNDVVGRVGLLPHDPSTWRPGSLAELGPNAEIELGWTIARHAWSRGYATEAAAAVRDSVPFQRLVSIIQHGNMRSVRVAEKLGARLERDIVTSFGKKAWLYVLDRRSCLGSPSSGSDS
jgi:RimJ/RimL family protein N-acetyltransferase